MNVVLRALSLLLGGLFASVVAAQGLQTEQFSYQGRLLEHGLPATGEFDLRFSLHADEVLTGPSDPVVDLPAWPVVDGLVIAELSFPGQFDGRQRWLQMAVNGDVILPRQPILASPVSQFAMDVDLRGEVTGAGRSTQVTGARVGAQAGTLVRRDGQGAIEASLLRGDVQGNADSASFASHAGTADHAENAVNAVNATSAINAVNATNAANATSATTAQHAVSADTAAAFTTPLAGEVTGPQTATTLAPGVVTGTKIADGQVVRSLNGLRDGISISGTGTVGVSTSGSTIQIQGTGITGVQAGAGLTGGGTAGVVPVAVNFAGSGSAASVARSDHAHYGQVWSGAGNGLRIVPNSENARAIEGSSSTLTNFNGAGIAGLIFNTESESVGVYGSTSSTNPNSAAVFGQAIAAGGSRAIWGIATGTNNVAIEGSASGSGALAGRFFGNVQVNGSLSKGGGSFRIDHPLDPENKYLYHSFVESPDMKNIYDGIAMLDASGSAVVEMADWFEALNRDFRYQLTALDASMPGLFVSQTMRDGRFVISGGLPGARVSWMVTGIRQDAWAQAHRIPVEEVKPAGERGRYLHPEAWGLPPSRGVQPSDGTRAAVPGD